MTIATNYFQSLKLQVKSSSRPFSKTLVNILPPATEHSLMLLGAPAHGAPVTLCQPAQEGSSRQQLASSAPAQSLFLPAPPCQPFSPIHSSLR